MWTTGLPCRDGPPTSNSPPARRPRPAAQRGVCTTRRTATACRRRVAPLMLQFPPFARGNHGPAGLPRQLHPATTRPNHGLARRQRRPTGPHSAAQRGFCTTRRIATACRRRVAPLMLQSPPPFARANRHLARHQRRITGPRPVACPPSHRSPAHAPPPNGGFCTTRRTATACRRRVAPLMLQFPPLARANHGHARHQRRPTRPRPRASQSPGATGAPFKPYPLFRQNEIRPIQFVQTATK